MKAEVVILENEMKNQTELMNKNKTQKHKASMNAKFDEINQAHQKSSRT